MRQWHNFFYLCTKSINIVSCCNMLSLQQIEYWFIFRYQFRGDRPTINGLVLNLETPYLCRYLSFYLFIFVIDLSLFCLYNEWLHSLPTSLSSMAVATWYLCVLYISLVYHKKNLLFVIWTVWLCSGWTTTGQTHLAYTRGVSAPIFLVLHTAATIDQRNRPTS